LEIEQRGNPMATAIPALLAQLNAEIRSLEILNKHDSY
jgi:hypothetical protein